VPEIGIGRVEVGNPVDVTLDAFPGEAFRGTVSYIEASETQVDGVANFKINIAFDAVPEHMKSGLSTNLQIVTMRKDDVLLVPYHFLSFEGTQAYAYKEEGDKDEKTPVTLGARGEDGRSEVIEGLSEGDVLVTPPAKK
jgi:HlyD family secretion protein